MAGKSIIKPNLEMNENMAYFLGAMKGDGCVTKKVSNQKYYAFQFGNQDFEFTRNVFHSMQDIGLRPNIYNIARALLTVATSKILWEWYQGLTLLKLESMLKEDQRFILAFIQSFYESEGCYYYQTGKIYPFVAITNCNEELISFVHKFICELGFRARLNKMKRGKTAFKEGYYYHILIRRKEEAERFIKLINPCFKNKPSNKWF
jgi:hypothetical protein